MSRFNTTIDATCSSVKLLDVELIEPTLYTFLTALWFNAAIPAAYSPDVIVALLYASSTVPRLAPATPPAAYEDSILPEATATLEITPFCSFLPATAPIY